MKEKPVLIGVVGDMKVFKDYFSREIYPDDRVFFIHIKNPEDLRGRRFDQVIRIHGWENYAHLYDIAKRRLK